MKDMKIKSQDDFLRMMIEHHEAALPMAEAVLKLKPDAQVAAVARDIISSQTKQIEQMKSWLKPGMGDKPVMKEKAAAGSLLESLLRFRDV